MLTCSYGAKHIPYRSLYIIMWSDKWPNTLTKCSEISKCCWKLAIAYCYFELCLSEAKTDLQAFLQLHIYIWAHGKVAALHSSLYVT